MVTKERWGKRSQKVEKALLQQARKVRSKRTGKTYLVVPTFAQIAEKYGVTREFVRQVAEDLGIRSMYRVKGRGKSIFGHKK